MNLGFEPMAVSFCLFDMRFRYFGLLELHFRGEEQSFLFKKTIQAQISQNPTSNDLKNDSNILKGIQRSPRF